MSLDVITQSGSGSVINNGTSLVAYQRIALSVTKYPDINNHLSSGTMLERWDDRFDEHYGGGVGVWTGNSATPVYRMAEATLTLTQGNDFIAVTRTLYGTATITLPPASESWNSSRSIGRTFTIADKGFNSSNNAIIINRSGSDYIIAAGGSATESSVSINGDGDTIRIIALSPTEWMVY